MPHKYEVQGIELLTKILGSKGHVVAKSHNKTFDIIVDGNLAEVKTKGMPFNKLDFLSLTSNQHDEMDSREYTIYLVCNLEHGAPEFFAISSNDLRVVSPRTIISYEYDRSKVKSIVREI